MTTRLSRRSFLGIVPAAGLATAVPISRANAIRSQVATSAGREFPRHQDAEVRRVVGLSHRDLEGVRALVTARPALAKANWDWGFGDWESALGAAAHTGNYDIAAFLIDNGARPTLLSATMMGHLEVVQGFVAATPGIQRLPGPHGIPLLSHAVAGGDRARPVREYLESLGDAGIGPVSAPLTDAEREAYAGQYRYGEGDDEQLAVTIRRGSLFIQRGEMPARGMTYLGDHTFHPAGAPAVRIVFAVAGGAAASVTVHDPDPVVTARRVAG